MSFEIRTRKAMMLSIRISRELRDKLDAAVAASGRTLTQEVEMRLERSFMRDEFVGGPETAAFLNLLGAAIRDTETRRKATWTSDTPTWTEASKIARQLIEARRPQN